MSDKSKIKASFAKLRKEGFFARMNFLCCQSCAWAATPDVANVVFYHQQDADSFNSYGNVKPNDRLYLAHQGNSKRIVEVLTENGLRVEWNGKETTRIAIVGEL